jgi:signal transduction histidine kinase
MFRLKITKRLGGRIFLTFALALILLSGLFAFFTSHFGGQLIVRSSANELRVLSVVLSELIQNQFSTLEGSLEDIAENELLMQQLEQEQIQRPWLETYLREAVDRHPHLTDLMVYDLNGRCVGATDPDWYKIRGKDEKFFNEGLEGFNFPSIYGTESLGRVQLVSSPITRDDDVIGVVVAIIELKDIYQLMDQKIGLNETTDAFLLDEDLRFITAGRAEYKGLVESHLASTTLASHLKDEFWVGQYVGSMGRKVIGTALKIPGYSWYVVVERDYDDVVRQMTSLQRAVLFSTLGLLCIFIVASLALSRSITRPLLELVQSTRQIAAGKYGQPVLVSQEIEEVAFIGAELERMRRRIAISQERLKERLTESEQLRIESERLAAIGSLAASLAHEIRNPLNAMSLLLSRLQYSPIEDTRKNIIGDLFGEIGRLDRLVSSILDYARPIQLDRKTVDVRSLIASIVDLYRSLAEAKGVRLDLVSDGSVHAHIDSDRIKQCIVNLLKNSLDAMENGGVVTLACHESQEGLVIEVSDNGPGISKEIKPKLFSPFFTTKENGTGLGLSSVHKIIAAHGGHIEVVTDSQKNELVDGAKFIISIPSNLNW